MTDRCEQPDDICANCGCWIDIGPTGQSGIYRPNKPSILLCESCFFEEDELIERTGHNNHPDRVQHYLKTLARHAGRASRTEGER